MGWNIEAGLKNRLLSGQTCLGTWVTLNDLVTTRLMARVGFDWILIDTEHAPMTIESLEHMLFMFDRSETAPIVRLADSNPTNIKQALDVGAAGVMVPMVRDADDVRRVVDASRYPPLGRRGFPPRSASDFFRHLEEYVATANERLTVIVQIECPEAIENLDSILEVEGLDAVFIGPFDLSKSLGISAEERESKLTPIIEKIIGKAKSAGVPVGMDMWSEEVIEQWLKKGIQFCTMGVDWSFLEQGAQRTLAICKEKLSMLDESAPGS